MLQERLRNRLQAAVQSLGDGGTAYPDEGRSVWALRSRRRPSPTKKPPPREKTAGRGLKVGAYFFLPWFLTASMAAFAASGSR